MNEDEHRKEIEQIINKSISEIIEKVRESPFYYVNEEDIRCELYRKISKCAGELYFQNDKTKKIFLSNAIHSNAVLGRNKPDLLVYYAKNSKKNPILTTSVEDSKKHDIVHFFVSVPKNDEGDKRILIEIKFINHLAGISEKRKKAIIKDIEKLKEWDSQKKYFIFFDMGNTFDEESEFKRKIMELMGVSPSNQGRNIEFIYYGFPSKGGNKKEQYIHSKGCFPIVSMVWHKMGKPEIYWNKNIGFYRPIKFSMTHRRSDSDISDAMDSDHYD